MDTRAVNLRLGDVIRLHGAELRVVSLELTGQHQDRVLIEAEDETDAIHSFSLARNDAVLVDEYARRK